MRIVTTLMSLLLASATLGGCAASARVRVADAETKKAGKVAADEKSTAKGEGQSSAEARAAQPATDTTADPATDADGVPAHD